MFATYPDARVVVTHRDPLRVVGSLADMMATLRWMHSDHVDHAALVEFLCMGLELQMDARHRAARRGRRCPADRIADVRYTDLVADPVGCVARAVRRVGPPDVRQRPGAARARTWRATPGRAAAHDYRFEDTGLDLADAPRARPAVPGPVRSGLRGRGLGRGSSVSIHPTAW